MRSRNWIPMIPGGAIALSAMLFGVLAGALLSSAPHAAALSIRSFFHWSAAWAAIVVLLAAIVAALVVAKGLADQQSGKEKELLNAFLEHIPDAVYFKDRASRFLRISCALARRFGLADAALAVHKTDSDIFSPEHAAQAFEDEQKIIRTGQPITGKEEKETWPDGHESWVLTTKVPLRDRRGHIVGTMGISRDITDRKQAELRIRYMALHDALTGLPNRALLQDLLGQSIALAGRNKKRVAVFMLDLDRFKNVNDSFGHEVGDRLLEGVSVRLRNSLRESDIVARLAGDEFVVCLPMVEPQQDVTSVAQKLLATLNAPFHIEGHGLQIGASIGICEYPIDGDNPKELLQAADTAMYEAKKKGRGTYCYFTPELTDATRRRQKLEFDLQHALQRNEFVLYYQPLVSTASGRITGVETLLRWRHSEQGLIYPIQFVPQLEDLGLMVEVGQWVLTTACRQSVAWQREGIAPVRMMVNLSATQFYRGDVVNCVKRALAESGLDPQWLELELTEMLMLDDSDLTIKLMLALKQTGVSLSLDDFGTGWSSLSYLRKFPIDRIKIDRSFLRDIGSQPSADAIVRSIINLGRDLGLSCVAEGVETAEQLDYFKRQNCVEVQGFLYSPAVPGAECGEMLRSGKLSSDDRPPAPAESAVFAAAPEALSGASKATLQPAQDNAGIAD